jgi:hypothetical protein
VFHILDSLSENSFARKEASQLQNIMLQHFEGEHFVPGRIAVNVPKVIPRFFLYPAAAQPII